MISVRAKNVALSVAPAGASIQNTDFGIFLLYVLEGGCSGCLEIKVAGAARRVIFVPCSCVAHTDCSIVSHLSAACHITCTTWGSDQISTVMYCSRSRRPSPIPDSDLINIDITRLTCRSIVIHHWRWRLQFAILTHRSSGFTSQLDQLLPPLRCGGVINREKTQVEV